MATASRARALALLGSGLLMAVLVSACLPSPLSSIGPLAGTGAAGYSGDGGPATSAELNDPRDVVALDDGTMVFTDAENHRVRQIAPDGTITTIAGTGVRGDSGDGGPAVDAEIAYPAALALALDGSIYVASYDNRVRHIDLDGTITTAAGTGVAGWAGDGGPATAAHLNNPSGLAVDPEGNLFIADAFNQRIRRVDPSGIITTIAGDGPLGFGGDGGPALRAYLFNPSALAVDGDGNLYVSDWGNARIRRIDARGIITTVAGMGNPGYSGDGGPATSARISAAGGIVVDGAGNLIFTDTGNHRIRAVLLDGRIVTVAATGSLGWSGDGGPPLDAEMAGPEGIVFDGRGRLVIVDRGNQRLRLIWQGSVIGGSVTSAAGGGPVEGATVELYDASDPTAVLMTTMTDAHGRYAFQTIEPGSFVLRFEAPGLAPEWFDDAADSSTAATVTVTNNEQRTVDATLGAL